MTKEEIYSYLGNFIKVKVGAASGSNSIFENEKHGIPFVVSETNKTGKYKKYIYNVNHKSLLKHKEYLINRKIGNFHENNWYMWGRKFYESKENRVYVNSKTRNLNPFFYDSCKNYDGSVMAIFSIKDNLTYLYFRKAGDQSVS